MPFHQAAKIEILPATRRNDAMTQRADVVGNGLTVANRGAVEVGSCISAGIPAMATALATVDVHRAGRWPPFQHRLHERVHDRQPVPGSKFGGQMPDLRIGKDREQRGEHRDARLGKGVRISSLVAETRIEIDRERTRELGPGEVNLSTLAYFVGMTRLGSQVVSGGNSVHSASANSMVRKIGH